MLLRQPLSEEKDLPMLRLIVVGAVCYVAWRVMQENVQDVEGLRLPRLLPSPGRARAKDGAIADRCELSPRHLQRRSSAGFGYGPKTLARVFRLQRALRLARAGTPFAAVSAEAGFADQAHLAREVKAMAGVPLGSLITPAP